MTCGPERAARAWVALAALLALSPWAPALGGSAPERHCLWELRGDHNTVFLLGSVHMLSAADAVLPQVMVDAYAKAAALVMELDLNDVGAESMLGSAFESTLLPEGQSLSEVLGSSLYAEFEARAGPLGIDATMAERLQPWFAALMLEQLTLAQSGLAADAGVDMQLAHRAQLDHKPIIALETVADQLGYFSKLTLAQQKDFLRTTLRELDTEGSDTALVVRAWHRGDTVELERLMHKDAVESPELFRILTADRNRNWLPRITALLHESQDYLVVVGALHLIGRDGLVELLRREGHEAVQR